MQTYSSTSRTGKSMQEFEIAISAKKTRKIIPDKKPKQIHTKQPLMSAEKKPQPYPE